MMLLKGAVVIIAGTLASAVLYPLTEESRKLPQLFGLAAGCLLIDLAIYVLWRDEESAARSFIAQALVGLGVAANRARLEWLSNDND
jgi:hypothetical protein